MHTFLKVIFVVVWTTLMLMGGCMIGSIGNKNAPTIIPQRPPLTKYELLLKRKALTVQDEKQDSYILKKCTDQRYVTDNMYEIFPATEKEAQAPEK